MGGPGQRVGLIVERRTGRVVPDNELAPVRKSHIGRGQGLDVGGKRDAFPARGEGCVVGARLRSRPSKTRTQRRCGNGGDIKCQRVHHRVKRERSAAGEVGPKI